MYSLSAYLTSDLPCHSREHFGRVVQWRILDVDRQCASVIVGEIVVGRWRRSVKGAPYRPRRDNARQKKKTASWLL